MDPFFFQFDGQLPRYLSFVLVFYLIYVSLRFGLYIFVPFSCQQNIFVSFIMAKLWFSFSLCIPKLPMSVPSPINNSGEGTPILWHGREVLRR